MSGEKTRERERALGEGGRGRPECAAQGLFRDCRRKRQAAAHGSAALRQRSCSVAVHSATKTSATQ